MALDQVRVRSAALALHGLPEEKRQAVLATLTVDQRLAVEPMLRELAELGLPATASRFANDTAPLEPMSLLDSLSAEVVVPLLDEQSPHTVALLLGARDWPWKAHVIERLDPQRREAVRQHLVSDGIPPPLVAQAVVDRFQAAVEADKSRGDRRKQKPSFLGGWLSWKR